MDPENKQAPATSAQGSGYGYNYGGSYAGYSAAGYGYGAGGEHESSTQRTLQDYLLILRERVWYIVVVFLVVFSSSLVFTLSLPKIYQSVASVQIFRRAPVVMQMQNVMENEVRSAEDLNTQVKVLESGTIIQKVAERITGEDLRRFTAPLLKESSEEVPSITKLLQERRKIVPQRLSLVISVQFEHQDPQVAAKVANLFVDEYIAYNARMSIDQSLKAVEELKVSAEEQRRKVDELAAKLQAYREKNNMVALDSKKDIVNETLKQLNLNATQATNAREIAEIRSKQIKERVQSGGDLSELPFIANQELIKDLSQKLAAKKIEVAQLRNRYREKHPTLSDALSSLAQIENEFKRAIDAASASIESEYQTAIRNEQAAKAALDAQKTASLELDRYGMAYTELEREFRVNEQLLQSILGRRLETTMSSNIDSQNARVIDRAVASKRPISPNIPLNLGLGFLGGIGLGLAFAFFVAYVDDRVKSSFDIEGVVGLPLIGIIPEIKRMEQPDKAQIVANNADRQVSEAFLTLHSSLRLKDESKNAKVILTTSTIPGEGKSFMTTNLALTFAAHGEKVVVIDCDLRKPNVHKSFRIENLKGVIDIVLGKGTIDDVVVKNLLPNLDVIPAGGRAKNPTQILNSKNFELMLSDLKKRYDRVFVDTPPLAAVSDAMIVLPLCDGSIFTIFFNKVRRKAAQFAAKKLLEANVPVFGAVLNGLNLAVSGYYYSQYYDKSYKDYYVVMAKKDDQQER
ncbi:MAG: polysaccharide biosynthesis tyrosine autokinase [Opitutae bacterium]|nr:polysaccharide biosynthesis tyrosine autokinase [Opitutae bacterium]